MRTRKRQPSETPAQGRNKVQNEWQLQDAKARFSELFRLARECGPQRVTKHGKAAVVVLTAEDYDRLRKPKQHKGSLVKFFADSPLAGVDLEFERPSDYGRPVKL